MADLTFGEWLDRQRKGAGLTQKALAQKMGCAVVTLRKIEADERRPSVQFARQLASFFGVPMAEEAVFLSFARGDWTRPPAAISRPQPWQVAPAPRSNLPAVSVSLIGRDEVLARNCGSLREAGIRLLTLTGPPGIGKTSLSLEIGRNCLANFPDGVFFVSFAALDDPALLASAVTQALGYVLDGNLSAEHVLSQGIGNKEMLLVLDNCEHLVEGAAQLAAHLLAACPRLKILATSRESLRVPGEWLFAVPALELTAGDDSGQSSPALRLFVERARAARAGFELTPENIPIITSICARLDGLPLAIELIAARMRLFSPRELLDRLAESFVLSVDGARTVSPRHKKLGSAIGWSYNLLAPQERRFFEALGGFPGSFTLEAAGAVYGAAESGKIEELMESLIDKSLLQRLPEADGEARFGMLVTIRQFALQRLALSGGESTARDALLAYCVGFAERGDREMRGPRQAEWIDRLEAEHNTLRAGLEWGIASGQSGAVLRLLGALGWPWEVRGHYNEALAWLEKVRSLPDLDRHPVDLARILSHIGRYCWTQDRYPEALRLLEEARELAEAAGQDGALILAETLNWLGLLRLDMVENRQESRELIRRGLELYRLAGSEWGQALSTFHLGIVDRVSGNNDLALPLFEQSLGFFRKAGDVFFAGRVCLNVGYMFFLCGELELALPFLEEHQQLDEQLQFWNGIAEGWHALGSLHRQKGDEEQALVCFKKCEQVSREHGLPDRNF